MGYTLCRINLIRIYQVDPALAPNRLSEVVIVTMWKRLSMAAGALAVAAAVNGHHSVSGVFDARKPFEISGVVTEVEWINPHIYLHVDVKDASGQTAAWQLETLPTAFMRKAGITKAMLEGDGEAVTITGIASHTLPNVGWIRRITFPDGRYYQLSGS